MMSEMAPRVGVDVGDGQRDALAILGQPDDDELPGTPLAGDDRRLDPEPDDVRRQRLVGDDSVHREPRRKTHRATAGNTAT